MYASKLVIKEFTDNLEKLNHAFVEADRWEVRILDAFARSNQDPSLRSLGEYLIQAKNEAVGFPLQHTPSFIRYMLKRYPSLKNALLSFKPAKNDKHPDFDPSYYLD